MYENFQKGLMPLGTNIDPCCWRWFYMVGAFLLLVRALSSGISYATIFEKIPVLWTIAISSGFITCVAGDSGLSF